MKELMLIENPEYQWDNPLSDDFGLDEDEEPYDFDEILSMKKPRRKSMSETIANPMDTGIGTAAMLGGVFYFFWCLFHYNKTRVWSWTPWKSPPVPVSRRLAAVAEPGEQKVVNLDTKLGTMVHVPSGNEAEHITLIVP